MFIEIDKYLINANNIIYVEDAGVQDMCYIWFIGGQYIAVNHSQKFVNNILQELNNVQA